MAKTWISIPLETMFAKDDKFVKQFLHGKAESAPTKAALEIEVKHFIAEWLRRNVVPFHVDDPIMNSVRESVEQLKAEQSPKNEPQQIEITENEKALLLAIRDSEYNDGTRLNPVWVDCLWGFEGKAKFGGVMASLTKKNLAGTDGECAWLTQIGLDRIKDEPYKSTIDRARDEQGYVSSQEAK